MSGVSKILIESHFLLYNNVNKPKKIAMLLYWYSAVFAQSQIQTIRLNSSRHLIFQCKSNSVNEVGEIAMPYLLPKMALPIFSHQQNLSKNMPNHDNRKSKLLWGALALMFGIWYFIFPFSCPPSFLIRWISFISEPEIVNLRLDASKFPKQ